jgi:hypothetical protein
VTSPNAHQQAAPDGQQQSAPETRKQAQVRRDPQVIEREIEQTRAELAESIDAITWHLSPKRLANRGARVFRDQCEAIWASPASRTQAIVVAATVVVVAGWAVRRRSR